MQIGIIGLGKMGEAIAMGLRSGSNPDRKFEIQATTRSSSSAKEISRKLSIFCHTDNQRLVRESNVILLCVQPHQAKKVLEEVAPLFRKDQLLLSICASLTLKQLKVWSGGKASIVRAMPNTPCLVGRGMTVISADKLLGEQLDLAREIFNCLGKTEVIDESLMDAATGLSGCGPAYAYLIVEALSEGGVKLGLSRRLAIKLAAQTLSGASEMVLQRGVHPAELKDEVTTPAGCTVDGLVALEEGRLRVTLIKAVLAAAKRSKKLKKKS